MLRWVVVAFLCDRVISGFVTGAPSACAACTLEQCMNFSGACSLSSPLACVAGADAGNCSGVPYDSVTCTACCNVTDCPFCPACTSGECTADKTVCPATLPFYCIAGPGSGGCQNTTFTPGGGCDVCCNLDLCPTTAAPSPGPPTPSPGPRCPPCELDLCVLGLECPPTAPYYCIHGSAEGGCSPSPYTEAICDLCCNVNQCPTTTAPTAGPPTPSPGPRCPGCTPGICTLSTCPKKDPYFCVAGDARGGCNNITFTTTECAVCCDTDACPTTPAPTVNCVPCKPDVECLTATCPPKAQFYCAFGPAIRACSNTSYNPNDCYFCCDTNSCPTTPQPPPGPPGTPAPAMPVPAAQISALKAFYVATGGSSWIRSFGWDNQSMSSMPCEWAGVGCADIRNQQVITTLDLQGNNLHGTVPTDFLLVMNGIVNLLLSGNPGLTGSIPDLPNGSNLTVIDLNSCNFTGGIPATLFTSKMIVINLQQNRLTGSVPSTVSQSPFLNTLIVGQNRLSVGALSSSICSLGSLMQLDLSQSELTLLPSCFSTSFPLLSNINLQFNLKLGGLTLDDFCGFRSLSDVYLVEVSIGGTIPACFTQMTSMQNFIIQSTNIGGTLPQNVFENWDQIVSLHLALSNFEGHVPDFFGSLPHLKDVFIAGKKCGNGICGKGLTDPIPASLFQSDTIESLTIQFTRFTEPLPDDLSKMASLSAVDFSNNPDWHLPFPATLFTTAWTTKLTDPNSPNRSLHFDFTPLYGTIPFTSSALVSMNSMNAFGFTNSLITGYIPTSTVSWVPSAFFNSSLKNMVQDCSRLLPPIRDWVFPLLGTTKPRLLYINVRGIVSTEQVFSMSGGVAFNVSISDELIHFPKTDAVSGKSLLYCGFCIVDNHTLCTNMNAYESVSQVNVVLMEALFTPGVAVLTCKTPRISQPNPVMGVYYKGPGYGSPHDPPEIYLVSYELFPVRFYNPHPHLASLSPSSGRIEGCSLVTAVGYGFTNAPNATLTLNGEAIVTGRGSVLNDTAATFLIPLAADGNWSVRYNFAYGVSLDAMFLPAGNATQHGTSVATYEFQRTCNTPLVPCEFGMTDPESCPSPLCRCNSAGECNFNSTEQTYTCSCLSNFNGSGCEKCAKNYFGWNCDTCPCDLSHGTCDWGISNSGKCDCDPYFIGSDCTVSVVLLGTTIPLALGMIAGAIFVARRKKKTKFDDDFPLINK